MADHDSPQPQEGSQIHMPTPMHDVGIPFDEATTYAMDRLSQAFETSARRWELIVYPSVFAFIVLAAYGFYLVFSLAKDMHYLTTSVDTSMGAMSSNMQAMADNMGQMAGNLRTMAVQVESMAKNVNTMQPMLDSIKRMDQSMQSMTFAIHNIRGDTSNMNQHIGQVGRPMQFFNNFMPW